MRSQTLFMLSCAALCSLAVLKSFGHPASGIVVDHQGNVFFSDVSRGLLKVDPQGRVTTIAKNGGHWLALDANGSISGVSFSKRFSRYKLTEKASLILGTDSPLVVTSDGSLCFVCDDERMTPGVRQVARLSSDGSKLLVSPQLLRVPESMGGIKGLANGADGTLFASYSKAMLRIARDGTFSTVLNPVDVPNCSKLSPDDEDAPSLRGLAVNAHGTIYVAATGCRSVLKITADTNVVAVLKAESPWSPCGVALHGNDLYVLEHRYNNPAVDEDWPPRIRKVEPTGKVTTLVTFPPATKPSK